MNGILTLGCNYSGLLSGSPQKASEQNESRSGDTPALAGFCLPIPFPITSVRPTGVLTFQSSAKKPLVVASHCLLTRSDQVSMLAC